MLFTETVATLTGNPTKLIILHKFSRIQTFTSSKSVHWRYYLEAQNLSNALVSLPLLGRKTLNVCVCFTVYGLFFASRSQLFALFTLFLSSSFPWNTSMKTSLNGLLVKAAFIRKSRKTSLQQHEEENKTLTFPN